MAQPAKEIEGAPARRRELYGLLGDLPPRDRRIGSRTISVEERPGYLLEKLELDVNGMEPAPAYFVRPKELRGKAPAILFNHWHAGEYKLGKDELLRPKPNNVPSYADALTAAGYCALCLDMWCFGGRSTRTEMDAFKEMIWNGQVLWGMMVYDTLRGLDYLLTRPEVDAARVGTLGMSMGSTMAWWVAALDTRLKLCVDICCLTDYQALIEAHNLKGHGIYYFVPGLLKHFTTAQINTLIAPRPHLATAGRRDDLTPPAGLDRIDHELQPVYGRLGKPGNWKLLRYDVGHAEPPEMRRDIMAFLGEKL
ncbi:MAG: dienelactone hydrolase family protein [Acidobacteriia bacterium]|nr:dienelactone hydrolase family protein [Terriglobia bacterium]